MKQYHKLVRDNIPDIIRAKGDTCTVEILTDKDYEKALTAKLQEEVAEFTESGEVMELADIEEVLRAILDFKKVPYAEFEAIRRKKKEERGGFSKKLFLVSTCERENISETK